MSRDRWWIERHAPRDRRGRPTVAQLRDLELIRALWRGGFLTLRMIAAEWWPGGALRTVRRRMTQLSDVGWIARSRPRLAPGGGSHEFIYYLTDAGFRLGQRTVGPDGYFINPLARWRAVDVAGYQGVAHDLQAHAWLLAYRRALGERLNGWRGIRESRIEVPTKLHQGRHRPMEFEDLQLPGTQRVDNLTSQRFTPLVPDAVFELQDPDSGIELDVLIEYDRTGRPAKNAEKLLRSDALLCGWWFHVARWRDIKQRPVILFVCQTDQHLHAQMRAADELLTGRIARPGNPVDDWPYPGRRYARFAVAHDLHAGNLRAWRLPDRPTEHTGQPLELCETQLSGTR